MLKSLITPTQNRPSTARRSFAIFVMAFGVSVCASAVEAASGLVEITIKQSKSDQAQPQTQVGKNSTRQLLTGSIKDTSANLKTLETLDADAPLLIAVSLKEQRLELFQGNKVLNSSKISSGKDGHNTPTGIFSILEKKKYHESNIYSDAPMPYMQRLTWSGIALHESKSVPNYPASHGCVRLPNGFAKELFAKTSSGGHVIIATELVQPRAVRHPTLFQPDVALMARNEVQPQLRESISDLEISTPVTANNSGPIRIYLTRSGLRDQVRETQEMLVQLGYLEADSDGIYGKASIDAMKRFQQSESLQISGAITDEASIRLRRLTGRQEMANGRIYVRQNHEPIFDAPVQISKPELPLGTHLFMTTGFTQQSTGWIAVSIASKLPSSMIRQHDVLVPEGRVRETPERALDRIKIADDVRDHINKLLTEGTSFIISDNGWGTETGKGTDFIVPVY